MALIISLAKFSVISILLSDIILKNANSRESFDFDLGQKVNILSDKAFRKSNNNEFQAIGNVVITHMKNSIYGEKASVNFTNGETEVLGNVRYIAPEMTLYGTKLNYNFITKKIDLSNARILSDNFIVTGKKILRSTSDVIYAEEAEYTTCKDCPESWSVFGKKIVITLGKYVRIQNAFIKVKGVTVMYFPYILFPIKQKRESGLLFPLISTSSIDGFKLQQPFFLVVDDYKDLTVTPSYFGNRGWGGEFQYRQNIKEKTWFELNTIDLDDKIYAPNKINKDPTGNKIFRHFSDIEGHYINNSFLNGHLYFNETTDLDTIRDLDFFSKKRVRGTETGGGGFLEARWTHFSFGVQSFFNKNMLVEDPREFDDRYVQILPKLTLASSPYNLIHSDYFLLKNISVGLSSDYTIFKQNKKNYEGPIRNAQRLNLTPYLDWRLGNIGPIAFSHQAQIDYQNYNLPTEKEKNFSKKGIVYRTEAKIELEKIYGLSYIEEDSPVGPAKITKDVTGEKISSTIGSLPSLRGNEDSEKTIVYNHSYKHWQEFKLRHYYLGNQKLRGNAKFKEQIENDDGQFDNVDAPRNREHLNITNSSQDSIPLSNTLELQWNNNLIKKTPKKFDPYVDGKYLKDNFLYSEISYLNISQGLDLTVNSEKRNERLTRLYISTGINLDPLSFGVQEFYFHKTHEHKFISTASYTKNSFRLSTNFQYTSYNSINTPNAKLAGYDLSFGINDLFTIKNKLDYNFESRLVTDNTYSIQYAPINNCWKVELNYTKDLIDKRIGILLYINYNSNNFASINVN